MEYLYWLLGISAAMALLERLVPNHRAQPVLRRQLINDLFYLVFHGYLYWQLFGTVIQGVAGSTRDGLAAIGLAPEQGLLVGAPFLVQFFAFLVASDFLQWNVHRLLHRVPLLWQFHKVHHSIQEMDWAGNFRFHWAEVVVYRSILYVPIVVWLGYDPAPQFLAIVIGTAWGHFNHANVNLGIGPLAYVFNSPRMHLWHHDASDEGGTAKNFGIVLSVWDWTFGTAYWPRDREPERIGYPGDEEMPRDLPRQLVFPLWRTAKG